MQNETKNDQEKVSGENHEGWKIDEVSEESTNKPSDEITREILRGNENEGDANERDVVGAADSNETAQGREEAKKDEGKND